MPIDLSEARSFWDDAAAGDFRRAITGCSDEADWIAGGERHAELVTSFCLDPARSVILDWGCGAGRCIPGFSRRFRRVVAVDLAAGMLDRVEALRLPNVSTLLIDGTILPLLRPIDVIHSCACWMHAPRSALGPILTACAGALGPGGQVIFQLPIYATGRDLPSPGGVSIWTLADVETACAAAGLRLTDYAVNPGTYEPGNPGPNHFALHQARKP